MLKLSKIHQKKRVSLVPEKKSILPLPLLRKLKIGMDTYWMDGWIPTDVFQKLN